MWRCGGESVYVTASFSPFFPLPGFTFLLLLLLLLLIYVCSCRTCILRLASTGYSVQYVRTFYSVYDTLDRDLKERRAIQ